MAVKIRATAYRTYERVGLIWVGLGVVGAGLGVVACQARTQEGIARRTQARGIWLRSQRRMESCAAMEMATIQ
jgi:hypothetical protein